MDFDNRNSNTVPEGYCEAEELARQIMQENREAGEAFESLDELTAYIREAMASNYQLNPGQPRADH